MLSPYKLQAIAKKEGWYWLIRGVAFNLDMEKHDYRFEEFNSNFITIGKEI